MGFLPDYQIVKVLITDKLSPLAVDILTERGLSVSLEIGVSKDRLLTILPEYQGWIVRSTTRVAAEFLKVASHLKVVGRAGIGVDNIDVKTATALGIVVMNTPFGNTITTAEHTLSMMMALARDIPNANASTKNGAWDKNRFLGIEIFNKVLGIIGCGNIGSIVAERALGLKMKVIVHDPFLSDEKAHQRGVTKVSLNELLESSDFITLHTPLTDSTRHILNAETLARCKPGVCIVNCARGGLILEDALKQALDHGRIAAAALDVFETEPPCPTHPLLADPRVICTPHLGAATIEAQENVAIQIANQIADFLLQGSAVNALNLPTISVQERSQLHPYFHLAESLGTLAGQVLSSGLRKIEILYQGDAAALNCKPLTALLLKGLFSSLLECVNMVNAPLIARERGIHVIESQEKNATLHQTILTLIVTTDTQTRSFSGALIDGYKPRIVAIDSIPIEAEISPLMLLVRNEDKPGFIGRLGTILGNADINIASFHLGRIEKGVQAVSLIAVDQPIDPDTLRMIAAISGVIEAYPITIDDDPARSPVSSD